MRTRLLFTAAALTLILASAACNRAAQITGPREPNTRVRADETTTTTTTTTDNRGPGLMGGGS